MIIEINSWIYFNIPIQVGKLVEFVNASSRGILRYLRHNKGQQHIRNPYDADDYGRR